MAAATAPTRKWVVHKFGGTSMGTPSAMSQVAQILEHDEFHLDNLTKTSSLPNGIAVVVSALSGVTNDLIDVVQRAKAQDRSYSDKFHSIISRHYATITELFGTSASTASGEPAMKALTDSIQSDARDVTDLLRAIFLSRTCSEALLELISGYGEMWSSKVFAAYLRSIRGLSVAYLDAKDIVVIRPGELGPDIQWEIARARMREWLSANVTTPDAATGVPSWKFEYVVIPGFVATTTDGLAATLKRNGSDFSGTIFGNLLQAVKVVIWTDVDGMFSADPRKVPGDARRLEQLSYLEALELSYFGAKVLHPPSLAPCMSAGIPLWIKNTFNPNCPGTLIHSSSTPPQQPEPARALPNKEMGTCGTRPVVKGFSMIDGIALVSVEGTGMIGVPGVAQRLFGSLKDASVNVILISQASSEHSICVAVHESQAEAARTAIEAAFFREISILGHIQHVEIVPRCAILAAVGDGMVDTRGVAARLFSALAWAGVNLRAIAQGSSERNISAVVASGDAARALRTAHAAFFLHHPTVAVGVIGATGLVGSELMRQLEGDGRRRLRERTGIDLRVRGLARSDKMVLGENIEIESADWRERLRATAVGSAEGGEVSTMDIDKFISHVKADYLPYAVIIDCTATDTVPRFYPIMVDRGCHVVAANKKGFAGEPALYRQISERNSPKRLIFYETTVGAGLPVIKTVRELVDTGDKILRIEAVLSGTLSYLFNEFSRPRGAAVPAEETPSKVPPAFSEIVAAARAAGYTEPDPRDDLCGADFARKLVILAREAGAVDLTMADVAVDSLVPHGLEAGAGVGVDEFMKRLGGAVDVAMAKQREDALSRGEVLRFVGTVEFERASGGGAGTITAARASLGLRCVAAAHPFAGLSGADNVVSITTERYNKQPMVIRGPGAGAAVTAAGIVGDLVALASSLTSPPGWVHGSAPLSA